MLGVVGVSEREEMRSKRWRVFWGRLVELDGIMSRDWTRTRARDLTTWMLTEDAEPMSYVTRSTREGRTHDELQWGAEKRHAQTEC